MDSVSEALTLRALECVLKHMTEGAARNQIFNRLRAKIIVETVGNHRCEGYQRLGACVLSVLFGVPGADPIKIAYFCTFDCMEPFFDRQRSTNALKSWITSAVRQAPVNQPPPLPTPVPILSLDPPLRTRPRRSNPMS